MQRLQLIVRSVLRVRLAQQNISKSVHQHELRTFALYTHQAQKTDRTSSTKSSAQKPNSQQHKITLIAQNQAMSITTLEEAQKLAKRRELHLLRLGQEDAKTGRAMYKLVTTAEMLADETSEPKTLDKGKKTEKSLTIGGRIADHDLESRLKNIVKWLSKSHEVRVLIQASGGAGDDGDRIVKAIEQTIKEPQVIGKIVQKRAKGASIKFNILPVLIPTATATSVDKS